MQLYSGCSQAQGVESRGGILVVAAIGQVMVAQKHMDVRHFSVVYQGLEEAITGGEHMSGLMRPGRQEITTHNDALHLVLRGDGGNPGGCLGDAVQVMMFEVNVGQEQPLELCEAHCRDGIGTLYLLNEAHLSKGCILGRLNVEHQFEARRPCTQISSESYKVQVPGVGRWWFSDSANFGTSDVH